MKKGKTKESKGLKQRKRKSKREKKGGGNMEFLANGQKLRKDRKQKGKFQNCCVGGGGGMVIWNGRVVWVEDFKSLPFLQILCRTNH